jgi:hypothetical protein
MKKWIGVLGVAFGFGSAMPATLGAFGIGSRFADVTLENVDPGVTFNLRVFKNLPMIVLNLDNENGTDIAIETVLADAREMKDGYEPLPTPAWIQIVPDHFHLGPRASASADIVVSIPNDKKLVGHHFEGIIWVHTVHKNRALERGVMFETGLRHRIRLSIGTMGPESLQREKMLQKLATINTNFSISPDNLFVQDVTLGKTVDLRAEKKATIKIINEADEPVKLKMASAPADPNIIPQAGYANVPDPKWLQIEPSVVKVEGNSIKALQLKITIPDKPEYHHQKYMFLIKSTLADESLPLEYNNMLYVTTPP